MDYAEKLEELAKHRNVMVYELLENIEEFDTDQGYDDWLDELYPECKVGGYAYCTSKVLELVDPIAYRCGYSDYLDFQEQDGQIISFDNGDTYYQVYDVEKLIEELEAYCCE